MTTSGPRLSLRRSWVLSGVLLALVVAVTGPRALDEAGRWVSHEYDRLPWYVTRISALLAYLALGASVVYGLLLSTRLLDRVTNRAVSLTLHQDLAGIGLALALVHAAVLMIDRSVPYSPLEVVVPFTGPYRPLWVGIGQVTLALTMVVMFSFYVRKRIGTRAWRMTHYLSFVAFAGATVHGLMAGSDTSADWVVLGYLVMTTVVVFLSTYRAVVALADRRAKPGERATATGPSAAVGRPTGEGRVSVP